MDGKTGTNQRETEYDGYTYDQLVRDVKELASTLEATPTTQDAIESEILPCLDRIYSLSPDGWLGVLDDAGLEQTQVREYGDEAAAKMLDDVATVATRTAGETVTSREYSRHGEFPTSVAKARFGSWSEACKAADVRPGEKHGDRCTGPRGEEFESKHEVRIAKRLASQDIPYTVHPQIEGTNWVSDFYLPGPDLWVEVDGYTAQGRPNAASFERKIAELRSRGESVTVITDPHELDSVLADGTE